MGERTIARHLADLVAAGWIIPERRAVQGGDAKGWILVADPDAEGCQKRQEAGQNWQEAGQNWQEAGQNWQEAEDGGCQNWQKKLPELAKKAARSGTAYLLGNQPGTNQEPTNSPSSPPPGAGGEPLPLADASTGDLFSAFSPSQTEDQTHAASGTRTRLESTDVDDRGQSAAPTHSESKSPAESKSAASANGVRKWTREQVLEGEADGWQRRKGQQPPEALVDLLAECWAAAVDPHASDKQRARRARGAGARAEIAAALAGTQRRRGEPPSSALRQLEGMTASEWLMGRSARGDGTRYDAPRYAFRAQHASAALEAWERHGGPVDPRTGEPLVRGESGASVQIATGSSRDEWGDNTPEAYGWGAAGPFREWRTYDRPAFVREGRNVERHLADLAARRAEGVEPDPSWIEEDLERAKHWDRHGLRWWREQGYDPPRPSWMADEDEDEEDTQAARRGEEAA